MLSHHCENDLPSSGPMPAHDSPSRAQPDDGMHLTILEQMAFEPVPNGTTEQETSIHRHAAQSSKSQVQHVTSRAATCKHTGMGITRSRDSSDSCSSPTCERSRGNPTRHSGYQNRSGSGPTILGITPTRRKPTPLPPNFGRPENCKPQQAKASQEMSCAQSVTMARQLRENRVQAKTREANVRPCSTGPQTDVWTMPQNRVLTRTP